MKTYHVWILLMLTTLFWAGNYVFGTFVVEELSPVWITFSRWVLALFILIPLARVIEKPKWEDIKANIIPLIVLGLLGIIGYNLLLYTALHYTSPTNAALLSAVNPAVIVLFSMLLLKEKLKRFQVLGLAISMLGALLIITKGNIFGMFVMEYNRGDLIMVAAVVVWTLYSIVGKRVSVPPITATAVSTLFAMIMLAPFALAQDITFSKLSTITVVGVLYMFLFPSVFSFMFWNISVRKIGASQAGVFLNLIPVFTAIISLFLGESVRLEQIIGGLLVFLGVSITSGMVKYNVFSSFKKPRGPSKNNKKP
ncbi:DMT family transporter [Bacillus alkalicellulosilyticus]|uniref:DMT family transporter n=1 Tax=Alkalihalobacterium alkalicellulosilyticum TaxID=1912214 RepID=UPI001FE57BF2|nr:DMT family transporter [Bacillus alkalicellulosilyticus]